MTILDGTEEDVTWPDLVLLDLDLPTVDGHTVLQRRRERRDLARVPTIIITGSGDPATVRRCYEEGATAFISKPGELDEYKALAEDIVDFRFHTVTLRRA